METTKTRLRHLTIGTARSLILGAVAAASFACATVPEAPIAIACDIPEAGPQAAAELQALAALQALPTGFYIPATLRVAAFDPWCDPIVFGSKVVRCTARLDGLATYLGRVEQLREPAAIPAPAPETVATPPTP